MIHKATAALTCAIVLVSAGTASADWYENFNSLPLNYNWSWGGDGAIFAIAEDSVYKAQTYGYPPSWASYGVGYPTNAPDVTFTDGSISVVLNPGGLYPTDDVAGLFIRTSLTGPDAGDGFVASVDMADGEFDLVRTDNYAPVEYLGHADFPADTGVQYTLSLRAVMDEIIATLTYPGGSSTLSGTDSFPVEAYAGLFVSADPDAPGFPLFAAFDNARVVTGIPEPATMVLMGLGGLALFGVTWRRRSRGK